MDETQKILKDIILDLRVMSVQHPQTLEVSQSIISRLYRLESIICHMEPIESHFGRPVRKKMPGD